MGIRADGIILYNDGVTALNDLNEIGKIVSHLTTIREHYQRLREITTAISFEDPGEKMLRGVTERAELLDSIEAARLKLDGEQPNWRRFIGKESLITELCETISRLVMAEITDTSLLEENARQKVHRLRKELSTSSIKNRAASLYTRHSG